MHLLYNASIYTAFAYCVFVSYCIACYSFEGSDGKFGAGDSEALEQSDLWGWRSMPGDRCAMHPAKRTGNQWCIKEESSKYKSPNRLTSFCCSVNKSQLEIAANGAPPSHQVLTLRGIGNSHIFCLQQSWEGTIFKVEMSLYMFVLAAQKAFLVLKGFQWKGLWTVNVFGVKVAWR